MKEELYTFEFESMLIRQGEKATKGKIQHLTMKEMEKVEFNLGKIFGAMSCTIMREVKK